MAKSEGIVNAENARECSCHSTHVTRRVAEPRTPVRLSTARQAATDLQERHELALGLRIALDVALRHRQARMARELLHVPETPPDLRHAARRTRNEGAAPRMRRTAV